MLCTFYLVRTAFRTDSGVAESDTVSHGHGHGRKTRTNLGRARGCKMGPGTGWQNMKNRLSWIPFTVAAAVGNPAET
jgi:hypothetical protein